MPEEALFIKGIDKLEESRRRRAEWKKSVEDRERKLQAKADHIRAALCDAGIRCEVYWDYSLNSFEVCLLDEE